ncbi:MAG: metallophosphoesterase family protein [Lachnospiraceae bacterium]|nr:metallophosphoesterase family protein [Lachnospiraceae bacterium]
MTEEISNYGKNQKIAVLSDTHGLLRPEVSAVVRDCSAVLHAGDVGSREVLEQLEKLAPVYAVRGNVDGEWAAFLPAGRDITLAGKRIFICHKKKDLPADLSVYDLVVYGHSHRYEETAQEKPLIPVLEEVKDKKETLEKTLLLNPGSCGPVRFRQPVTMAVLSLSDDGEMTIRKVEFTAEPGKGKSSPALASDTGMGNDGPGFFSEVVIEKNNSDRPAGPGKTGVRDDELLAKDPARLVEQVVSEIKRGKSAEKIARKLKLSEELVESISRMYYTHPGVSTEGILRRIGL